MSDIVTVTTPAPQQTWARLMREDPLALVTQSPAWTAAMAATGGWVDASRHYSLADGRDVVLPLVRRRGLGAAGPHASFGEGWGMGGPLAPAGPAVSDIAAVVSDLGQLASLSTVVRPNPLTADVWRPATADRSPIVVAKRAHVLQLDADAEVVRTQRFSQSARRGVVRAHDAGVEVARDVDGSLIPAFYDLFLRSIDRWAGRSNEPRWLARGRAKARDPERKLHHMRRSLGDAFRLYVAFHRDVPVAGIVVLMGANAHYTRGAMDIDRGSKLFANELLHWTAVQDACELGCLHYHMGETGASASLAQFKEKLGAAPVDYATYRFERLPLSRVDAGARAVVKRLVGFRDG